MAQISTIIVAAGSGKRLGSQLPKQYLELEQGRRCVLMHTIDTFAGLSSEVIVVVPQNGRGQWQEICQKYNYLTPHTVVEGAEERFFSVRNGLDAVSSLSDVVLVQDGVRPFASVNLAQRVVAAVEQFEAVVPAVPVVDSLRRVGGGVVSRSEFMAIQTPQGFKRELLQKAYRQEYNREFTDDGSVVEALGFAVEMVEGEVENYKITTFQDYKIACLLVNN